ncbi:hypothetical protein COEX109129_41795 [Corallococcus exiguus]
MDVRAHPSHCQPGGTLRARSEKNLSDCRTSARAACSENLSDCRTGFWPVLPADGPPSMAPLAVRARTASRLTARLRQAHFLDFLWREPVRPSDRFLACAPGGRPRPWSRFLSPRTHDVADHRTTSSGPLPRFRLARACPTVGQVLRMRARPGPSSWTRFAVHARRLGPRRGSAGHASSASCGANLSDCRTGFWPVLPAGALSVDPPCRPRTHDVSAHGGAPPGMRLRLYVARTCPTVGQVLSMRARQGTLSVNLLSSPAHA